MSMIVSELYPEVRIHPTALIENDVQIGPGSVIWDNVHIRHHTVLGEQCIVGEKTYIAYEVTIGPRCKINSFVYICNAVTLEAGVMVSAGTVFTNDRFPRATTPDLKTLRSSEPDAETRPTLVREGATLGANCTIGNDLVIGRWAMVGMGAIVTKSVPDFTLVYGQPARPYARVCKCGQIMHQHVEPTPPTEIRCPACELPYLIEGDRVVER